MPNQNCQDCNTSYDPETVDVPTPLPDLMCAICGTQLTQEQVDALVAAAELPAP